MEGRWTIHMRGWGHLVAPADRKDVVPGSWPVVPCDDAAIERGARALAARREPEYQTVEAEDFEDARTVLRAAGETT